MLVESYQKEFCLPPNPRAQHLRCYAYLDSDISEVLPYLNSVLGGYQFYRDPPSLTLKLKGRLSTVYSKRMPFPFSSGQSSWMGLPTAWAMASRILQVRRRP